MSPDCSSAAPRDAVRLDVVGVAVEAVLVVGDDDLGALLEQDRREPRRGLVDGRRPERPRGVVLRPSLHARVGEAEHLEARHAEDRRGGAELGLRGARATSPGSWCSRSGVDAVGRVAERAVGAGHEHRAHPLVGVGAQHAARRRRLVVGVRVDAQHGVRSAGRSSDSFEQVVLGQRRARAVERPHVALRAEDARRTPRRACPRGRRCRPGWRARRARRA